MHREFLMGNEAIARGALAAGVSTVTGYPGTPSTEVLETVAKAKNDTVYVEWSVNEKAALEVAAGAALSGARSMVTMKQVGLNVASDPLMSLAYIGVKAGMVIMVADDPGPISSQTEQDTRTFAAFSKLPCFDPTSVQEAYEMMGEAFELSEKYHTPVLFRPTTRICHAYASVTVKDEAEEARFSPEGFVSDPSRWVIFPRLSFKAHGDIFARNEALTHELSQYPRNELRKGNSKFGVAAQGISCAYAKEALADEPSVSLLKVATPYPFPEDLALEFLKDLDAVLCLEELDPVIEDNLIRLCGKFGLKTKILGKYTRHTARAGENTTDDVRRWCRSFLSKAEEEAAAPLDAPELPVRPPVLCAGCPHRASFLAVKEAMKGRKAVFCGDIGCYTLGNAAPLNMVDTCLCMGAGINMAQGIARNTPDTTCFAFVGDSTFFASGITGIVNAVYNRADMVLVILDNSTTAMTGHQEHPGTGRTVTGEITAKEDPEDVLHGVGVEKIWCVDPLKFEDAKAAVREAAQEKGVKALIFRSPCIARVKPKPARVVDPDQCVGCRKCILSAGCPAISVRENKAVIDTTCTGCGLCQQLCPFGAIKEGEKQ